MKKSILVVGLFLTVAAAVNAQDKKEGVQMVAPASAQPSVTPSATPAANPNAGEFKFAEMEYNFGTIKQGDVVNRDFEFTNTGKEPIIISEAHGSCGCTVPVWPKEPVGKGQKQVIKVTFNSAGKMGMQDKTVTINSNAKTNPIVLHLKGNVETPPPPAAPPTAPVAPGAPVEKK
jgi:hypothetical protein